MLAPGGLLGNRIGGRCLSSFLGGARSAGDTAICFRNHCKDEDCPRIFFSDEQVFVFLVSGSINDVRTGSCISYITFHKINTGM